VPISARDKRAVEADLDSENPSQLVIFSSESSSINPVSYSQGIHQMGGSCWTCRSRTIQCDQSRFPCSKCEKAGLQCFDKRPLRWVAGVAIRGKMRGRIFHAAPEVVNQAQLARRRRTQLLPDSAKRLAVDSSSFVALQDPRIHNLDRSSRFYIDYCKFVSRSSKRDFLFWVYLYHPQTTNTSANCTFCMTATAIPFGIYFFTPWKMWLCKNL
jgi:hypothetical protein